MGEFTGRDKAVNRRGFLKGSALFAAAVGLTAASPAFAQQQAPKPEEKKPEERKPEEKKPAEPSGGPKKEEPPKQAERDPNKLYDKNGREYRICERCGGNMYQEGDTWTCEQCGFSYTE